jgi:hypothetical protein
MRVVIRGLVASALLSAVFPIAGAWATPQLFVEAKKAGMPAKNCQYCHTVAMPKKEDFKPDELNDRGKFLLTDMQQRKLKTPDTQKLKDFPGGKEQK